MAILNCPVITDNIVKSDCGMKRGGLIIEVFVANFGEIDEISSTTNDKEMDTIVMKTNPATSLPYYWYSIVGKKDSIGLNNDLQRGNNVFVNQTLTFTIEGITKTSLAQLQGMADGEAVFIVKDYLGKYHILGRVAGLSMTTMSYGTGTAQDDLYGGAITFVGAEPEMTNLVALGTTIQVWDGTAPVTVTLD